MFGESFGGQTSYSAAVERPEHLVAIAPMQSPSSLYHDVVFPGGIKTTERGEIDNWPDVANLTSGGVIDADAEFAANRAHPTFDGFWRERSFVDCLDTLEIPVLAIGGWNDGYFRSGTLANIEANRACNLDDLRPVAALLSRRTRRGDDVGAENEDDAGSVRRDAAVAVRSPAGVVRPLAHRPDRRPDPGAADVRVVRGPGRDRCRVARLDGWDPPASDRRRLRTSVRTARSRPTPTPREPCASTSRPCPTDAVDALTFTSAPLAATKCSWAPEPHVLAPRSTRATRTSTSSCSRSTRRAREKWVNDGYLAASHRRSHTDPDPVPVAGGTQYCVGSRPSSPVPCRTAACASGRWRPAIEADDTARTGHRDHRNRAHRRAATPRVHRGR